MKPVFKPLTDRDIKKGCSKRTVKKVKKDFAKYERNTRNAKKVSFEVMNMPMDF